MLQPATHQGARLGAPTQAHTRPGGAPIRAHCACAGATEDEGIVMRTTGTLLSQRSLAGANVARNTISGAALTGSGAITPDRGAQKWPPGDAQSFEIKTFKTFMCITSRGCVCPWISAPELPAKCPSRPHKSDAAHQSDLAQIHAVSRVTEEFTTFAAMLLNAGVLHTTAPVMACCPDSL